MTLAKFAHDKNKIFGFNFAAPYTFSQYKEKILEIMNYCDFIFCNKEEALACSEYLHAELGLDTDEKRTNLMDIASAISSYNKSNKKRQKITVITDSSSPVTCSIFSAQSQGLTVFQVSPMPVEKELLLDSNGAGDSFVGGFFSKISLIESEQNYTKDSVVEFT